MKQQVEKQKEVTSGSENLNVERIDTNAFQAKKYK